MVRIKVKAQYILGTCRGQVRSVHQASLSHSRLVSVERKEHLFYVGILSASSPEIFMAKKEPTCLSWCGRDFLCLTVTIRQSVNRHTNSIAATHVTTVRNSGLLTSGGKNDDAVREDSLKHEYKMNTN